MFELIKRAYRYIFHGIPVITQPPIFSKISILSPSELLLGRTALITGGTSGIGFAIANEFLRAGAVVIITGRDSVRLENASKRLEETTSQANRVYYFKLDNSNISQIESSIPRILKEFNIPQIDILVNNAGINSGPKGCTYEENFDSIISTNLKGSFFMAKTFAEYLKSNHIGGNILNIASSSSERPATNAYVLSKWGIKGLTKGLARVYTSSGIVVNGIAPGPTATSMLKRNVDTDDLSHPNSLAGRLVHPCEVANLAVILVSDMCRMVVGDIVYVSGGAGIVYNEDIPYIF